MTCPKCGSPTLTEQKFCRSCGASLHIATQPLAHANTPISQTQRTPVTQKHEQANKFLLSGFIMMFAGAAIGVVGKKLMHEDIVTVIGVLMSLAGMFLMVYPYLLPSRTEHNTSSNPAPNELPAFQPPKSLPKEREIDYVPSITERTTNLLENRPATTPKQESGELES